MFNAAGIIKKWLKNIHNRIFDPLYDQYGKFLKKEIVGTCQSILDVGCGPCSPIYKFSSLLKYSVGVDAFELYLRKSQSAKIHNEYKIINVMDIENNFQSKSFDCVLASDLIEHLSKENGIKLIGMMEKIAKKKIIIYTPNGFLPQHEHDKNPYSVHLSGWQVDEMIRMGFRVIGIHGWKPLRGEVAAIKWQPAFLWERISLLTQLMTTDNPKHAFQLLCVKDL